MVILRKRRTDHLSKHQRSALMSRIRSRGNKSTEVRLAQALRTAGITGWRRHPPNLIGRPDFGWAQHRILVFVDGCFWHGCAICWRKSARRAGKLRDSMHSKQKQFWLSKIEQNKQRDKSVVRQLRAAGWRVLRIRECELRDSTRAIEAIRTLLQNSVSTK